MSKCFHRYDTIYVHGDGGELSKILGSKKLKGWSYCENKEIEYHIDICRQKNCREKTEEIQEKGEIMIEDKILTIDIVWADSDFDTTTSDEEYYSTLNGKLIKSARKR